MLDKQLLKRIFDLTRPYRRTLVIAIGCMIAAGLLKPCQAYLIKPLLDKIFYTKDPALLNLLPLAVILLGLVMGVFTFYYSTLLEKVGQSVVRDLRNRIFSHIHALPLSFFLKTPSGELISRVISDVTLIQAAVSNALVGVLKDSVTIIGMAGLILYLNWRLALMLVVFLPAAAIPIVIFGRKHRLLSTTNQQTLAQVSNLLHETISGNRIVKAFCMEGYESGRFAATLQRLLDIVMKDAVIKAFSSPLMELLGVTGIAFIIWYGGHQVIKGDSTPGTFFSFLAALIMFYEPIKRVSNINSTVQQGLSAAVRVFALLDIKPEIENRANAITLPPLTRGLAFENVSFSYDNKARVLDSINLQVRPGEVLALVGPSGGGKTTLANLVPRFYDVSAGRITIDGIDIRDATLASLRGQIAVVTQQTILFNDTVRNNIAYGDPDRAMAEITAAARAAHALDFIQQLPQGFDTVIGEAGARLSGGQQQRISIARALLKNAPILVLDEATSALDTESEREVQKALDNLMKNRTTLVIAHRLSTIRGADRIIVIKDGRIVEQGSHESLLANKGVYELLHNMQE
ncbi:MAG: lipid A export permease/ATP-binding protein MsbA [Deltaproteobacteria bacterium CG_4_10_14_3_um_filter_60_8]|nr:MAG: lipid A export permease/ATP-binding protein MsbA [Desulfobacterales bacterium CG2_30_60_27]PIP42978.1 MAG: lipid A export permease/ATP-binding protein MsbA [Deltaproteobacteria bacterium CG23_combo_of_CG06-09_8_20_14_all_60_8]PIY22462.1 MAG: lipid A export permease/ATP-binding protein MsbA [Deltaproteobacteria bacterium CG_4_10_14_3_um_filter_60_8]